MKITGTAPATRTRLWRPHVTGWMVGKPPIRHGARPRFWMGPDVDAGFSATPNLTINTRALVWRSADAARGDLARVFGPADGYYQHGFRIVRVHLGRPDGPHLEPTRSTR